MAITACAFSAVASEPSQEAGSKKSRVVQMTFTADASETTIPLTPVASGNTLASISRITNVSHIEVVEAVHRSATPTTIIRSWCDPAVGLYLGAAPGAVAHTCKLRVYGS